MTAHRQRTPGGRPRTRSGGGPPAAAAPAFSSAARCRPPARFRATNGAPPAPLPPLAGAGEPASEAPQASAAPGASASGVAPGSPGGAGDSVGGHMMAGVPVAASAMRTWCACASACRRTPAAC